MSYHGEGVQALVCAIDDLNTSNLIYADQNLRRVLQCLAYYGEFRDALAFCNQGFDYQAERDRAFSFAGDVPVLRLPKTPKNLVAFVAGLLMEFDQRTINLSQFADTYFPASGKQESFSLFCNRVVMPFKMALVSLVVDGIEPEHKVVERTVDFAPSGLQQQTEYLVVSISDTVRSVNIDEDDRRKLTVMIEGFAAALDSRDSLMIRAIWLGLKGALEAHKLCKKEVVGVDEALRLYLVSK